MYVSRHWNYTIFSGFRSLQVAKDETKIITKFSRKWMLEESYLGELSFSCAGWAYSIISPGHCVSHKRANITSSRGLGNDYCSRGRSFETTRQARGSGRERDRDREKVSIPSRAFVTQRCDRETFMTVYALGVDEPEFQVQRSAFNLSRISARTASDDNFHLSNLLQEF